MATTAPPIDKASPMPVTPVFVKYRFRRKGLTKSMSKEISIVAAEPMMNEAMPIAVTSSPTKFKFRRIGLTKSISKEKASFELFNDNHAEQDDLPSLVARSIFYMKPSTVRSVDNCGCVTPTKRDSTPTTQMNKEKRRIARFRKRKDESQGMITSNQREKMTIEARRLSPELKRKHKVFWSQMDIDDGNSSTEDDVPDEERQEHVLRHLDLTKSMSKEISIVTAERTMDEVAPIAEAFPAKFKFRRMGLAKSITKGVKASCELFNDNHAEQGDLSSRVARSQSFMKPSTVHSVDNCGGITPANCESKTTFQHTNKKRRFFFRKRKDESQRMISRKKNEERSFEARRLSPEWKRKHNVFWSQMDTDDGNSSSEDDVSDYENQERNLSISEE